MADVQRDPRRLFPAVRHPLQEVIEELFLQRQAVAGREQRPVRVAVDLEPLLRRRRLGEAVEVPARVDALAAPVGAREQRQRDPGEIGGPGPVPLVIERMPLEILEDVDPVLGQVPRSEEHTSELQSLTNLVCRLLLEKKKKTKEQKHNKT